MAFLKRIQPLFDRVLVKRVVAPTTVGGILLPAEAVAKTNEARVVSVGQGLRGIDGKFQPLSIVPGDTVILGEYRGDEVKINDEDYLLIREDEILARVVETNEKSATSGSGKVDIPSIGDLPQE
eukprot:TRINITY_DN11460_c0_g1_i1.p1 TRINITY_DN11460_c0_g1~~TRINITY_DN11460_c0_g1_i1.p1  ORF type:complete len:124 (-),score=52.01 TRINITY_DN11460_c0_g1_i1:238-609(-)